MPLQGRRALKHTCPWILLTFLTGGGICSLVITVQGPSEVDTKVGSNVTLGVSFSGALDPTVEWRKGDLPIATWTIGSSVPPDLDDNLGSLTVDSNGSLTFHDVQLSHSAMYSVRMSKSGVGSDTVTFTLRVFDDIENVSVTAVPSRVVEGSSNFTLEYSTLQGEAESVKWYFNGKAIENGTRYIIADKSLKIKDPTRDDTGQYTLVLENPFSYKTVHKNISVLYGPDRPVLTAVPPKVAFASGDSLLLSCEADGDPAPTASWVYEGQTLPTSQMGTLNLTNVQTSQSGVYTCHLVNNETKANLERNFTINIYESPTGIPVCSVQGVNADKELQYRCLWPGGTPEAQLSFPALNGSVIGSGDLNMTVTPSEDLNGKEVTCLGSHPFLQHNCSVTARGPADFLPLVWTTVDSNGKLVISIACASTSMPIATVTWSRGGQVLSSGGRYQISPNTTLLSILDLSLDTSDLGTYTCEGRNPLGSKSNDVILLGPAISDSSLFPNQDGSIATLTWETPRTSIITGFEVQMMGPDLLSSSSTSRGEERVTHGFRTIQKKPAYARSTDLAVLDPESTYQFRVIPVAGQTKGDPSEEHRIGPGGLSGPAIAGIAAGIPCGLLLLLLLIALIVFCVCKRKRRQTRYPVARAVEKVVASQPNLNAPHALLTGGLKNGGPPDYNAHQATAERSSTLPSTVPPPPVRMATTV
ncbi:hypothetical protein AGOR_G00119700 [Albula goreensis]|uniref:Ig-like domain-containing protein n=1 Tax=Albula goreensis TaxID=1534307 RepID=A0A8T3DDC8_9TELE|nr:hypothetical protein AGOR_G00119700 [Albula goreensis]